MFHGLGLELIRLLLHFNHLLVLLALLLKSICLVCITLRLVVPIVPYVCLLVRSILRQLRSSLLFFLGPLFLQTSLLIAGVQVTLAHFHNFDGLFLSILDFFPCFLLLELEQGDSICEKFDVILSALLRRSLAG